jgi:hypothetical protein
MAAFANPVCGLATILVIGSLSQALLLGRAASPIEITEFAAAGAQHLRDEDGDTPDWIEIQNRSGKPVDLAGWVFTEQARHTRTWPFPTTNLPPGQFLIVFASGKDRSLAGRALHTNFKLPIQGGHLVLRGPAGEISAVDDYPLQVPGVTFGLAADGAIQGDEDAPANSPSRTAGPGRYVYLRAPTPGTNNAPAACSGPLVQSLAHEPLIPKSDEPISVKARVTPVHSPIAEVHLRFRVMFGKETDLTMYDDGQHGDGAAADGIYGASIPAKVARPGQMLRYAVLARDDTGRMSRWPLFAGRAGFSSYQGTVVADPAVQTRLPVVHLFSDSTESADQRQDHAGVALFYQGELYDNVELGLHGQISRGFPKQSYNLHFPVDHRFQWRTNEARVHGITLMANFADKSKIRNTLAYEMIAASGCVGHYAFPVRVQMNGKFFSVAEVIEKGDERWLERVRRDPQGALYKMNNNLNGVAGAEKKTRKYESPRDLAAFARALSEQRPVEHRAAYAYDQVDLPQCISYLVAMALISSDDHGHKNYYLYRDSRHSGEWALFPWDVDLSWGRNWTGQYFNETTFVDNPLDLYREGRHKARNRLYNLLMQYQDFRQMYLRRLRTVMDELLQPPDTPAESLIIERRIRQLVDLVDPPDMKPSDAARDQAAWPSWGQPRSMRAEVQRIMTQYLPGRRVFLFKSPQATLSGDPIPAAQPATVSLNFGALGVDLPATEQYVCLTNQSAFAVDLSGWQIKGMGIEHRFRPGTVIPVGKSIYVVANAAEFRKKRSNTSAPMFVQGDWSGVLKAGDYKPLTLYGKDEGIVVRKTL